MEVAEARGLVTYIECITSLTLLAIQFLVFGAALTARRARHGPPQAAGTTPGSVPMDPPPLRL